MGGPQETEVKLRVPSATQVREVLRRVGAEKVVERHLEDNVLFDDPAASLRGAGAVLRLRETPHGARLTYKGPRRVEGGIKSREEWETPVELPAARAILHALGYRPIFRYQKYRESWTFRGQAIEVDETPIGTFLEIEGEVEGIHAVTAALGYRREDYVAESYVALFFASGGKGDMVFPG